MSPFDSYLSRILDPGEYTLAISGFTFTEEEARSGVNKGYGFTGDYQIDFLGDVTLAGDPAAVPTPALLPGLIGMGIAAIRKRSQSEVA